MSPTSPHASPRKPAPATPTLRDCLAALPSCPGVPRAALYRIGSALADASGAVSVGEALGIAAGTLARQAEVPTTHVSRAFAFLTRQAADEAARAHESAAGLGARLVTLVDPDYPAAARLQNLAPPVLRVRGELPAPGTPAVSIVGSRAMDSYGREAATLFARQLAAAGVIVISGFARGVDATAHRAALAAGGRTVAVLGCGLDVDYPRGHRDLGEEIARHGALLTEFACGEGPQIWSFPVRNRLIATLGAACLVIQASPRSGSLVTAHLALEFGRDVFAVPGRIFDPRASGTNALIRDGATPALEPRDVLERLGLRAPDQDGEEQRGAGAADGTGRAQPQSPLARALLTHLVPGDPIPLEQLVGAVAGLSPRPEIEIESALGALLELELGGWARRHPGPAFSRAL